MWLLTSRNNISSPRGKGMTLQKYLGNMPVGEKLETRKERQEKTTWNFSRIKKTSSFSVLLDQARAPEDRGRGSKVAFGNEFIC